MFGKKSKTFCFHISNFDAVYEKDIESLEKLERGILEYGVFTDKLDTEKGVFCFYIDYKSDPYLENPNFSVEKIRKFVENIGFIVASFEEKN